MFSVYDKQGVKLAYPENWVLADETPDEGEARLQLSIASPATAFWTLAVYEGAHDLHSLASQALDALKAEYPDAEPSDVEQELAGVDLVGHDVNFICLDLTITAQVRAFLRNGDTYLVFAQAEDRELEQAAAVFDAITMSLLSSEKVG